MIKGILIGVSLDVVKSALERFIEREGVSAVDVRIAEGKLAQISESALAR